MSRRRPRRTNEATQASHGFDQERAVAGAGFEESSAGKIGPLRPPRPV